jgi:hypothetical protein
MSPAEKLGGSEKPLAASGWRNNQKVSQLPAGLDGSDAQDVPKVAYGEEQALAARRRWSAGDGGDRKRRSRVLVIAKDLRSGHAANDARRRGRAHRGLRNATEGADGLEGSSAPRRKAEV